MRQRREKLPTRRCLIAGDGCLMTRTPTKPYETVRRRVSYRRNIHKDGEQALPRTHCCLPPRPNRSAAAPLLCHSLPTVTAPSHTCPRRGENQKTLGRPTDTHLKRTRLSRPTQGLALVVAGLPLGTAPSLLLTQGRLGEESMGGTSSKAVSKRR